METVCMFADISGFTKVGEACAAKGVRGNEELAFCINRYMEGMCKYLGKYGGDIIKFVGDAMIIMWPQQGTGAEAAQLTVRKAIQCALDIQEEMNNFQVISGVASLSVKIGIGFGKCALLYVGGVFGRAEYFTVGQSLTCALKSEEQCTEGGQVVVNQSAYQYVRDFYQSKEIDEHGEKFYLIQKMTKTGLRTTSDAVLLRSLLSSELMNKIAPQLKGCVPNAIIPYLQIGTEEYGSETRSLTVMFASLGVELSSAETHEGMMKIQKIVTKVQEQVYRLKGSVNKLVMDDKGSTLICLWGLSPMSSEDDAARAILTAFNIRKALNEIDKTWCNIGISSGELFSGVVGTSGGRKEFSVLGDVANLAARVMYWPKKNKNKDLTKNQIHCDLNTKQLASNFFAFQYAGHQEFKGKSISIPIFVPTEPQLDPSELVKDSLKPEFFIRPHMNPMDLESAKSNKIKVEVVGSAKDLMHEMVQAILKYFQQLKTKSPLLTAIVGEIGTGKSLLAIKLIEELNQNDQYKMLFDDDIKPPIFCSSLNSESQFSFLNGWRPVLQQMLAFYAKQFNIKREQAFKMLLNGRNFDKLDILTELFAVKKEQLQKLGGFDFNIPQVQPMDKIFQFVNRISYAQNVIDEIIELVTKFIQLVCDDNNGKKVENSPPVLVFLDTAHMLDVPSLLLLESINNSVQRIGIILLIQTDEKDSFKIHPDSQQEFDRIWIGFENLRVIDLPSLNSKELATLIKANAIRYQNSYIEEIANMTLIVDKHDTIKTEEQGKEWRRVLSRKFQTENKIVNVDEKICKIIIHKCAGNPLLSLQYFVNLLQNDFISIDQSGKVQIERKFDTCIKQNDYSSVPVPRIAIKINSSSVDRYLQKTSSKQRLRPGELENVVKSIVMMKTATVLGDEFEIEALLAIQPLRTGENLQKIQTYVKSLEAADFLEVLDGGDRENYLVRFNKPFLRETLYQLILYRDQKKVLHGSAAQYFLETPNSVIGGEKIQNVDLQLEILRQHLIKSQDLADESGLSLNSRTELQVRHIQNKLRKKEKYVIIQKIFKQGDAANKKTSERLCTIDSQFIRWYHDENELKEGQYLGSIPVQFVYQTVASKLVRGEKAAFSLSTIQWFDKKGREQEHRDFFFACEKEHDRDNWVITIEFLRTKAVYDAYANKNIAVQFPLSLSASKKQENHDQRDFQTLLWDFGSQLKQVSQVQKQVPKENTKLTNYNSNITTTELTHEELVDRLKACYSIGICSFSKHMINTSIKISVKQQNAQVGRSLDRGSILHEKVQEMANKQREHSRSEIKDEQAAKIKLDRRPSSVSENLKSTLDQLKQTNRQVIQEESEEQSSESEPRKNKSNILHSIQKLEVEDSKNPLIIQQNVSDSRSTTPPLSTNIFVQQASPPEEAKTSMNRQSFNPRASNTDSNNYLILSEDKNVNKNQDELEEPMQQLMQKIIEKKIGEKIDVIVKQNELNLLEQKKELGKIISHQQELLNRSMHSQMIMLQSPNSSNFQTPERSYIRRQNLNTSQDNRLIQLINMSGGITSTSKHRSIVQGASAKKINKISEESDPEDPDQSSSDNDVQTGIRKSSKYHIREHSNDSQVTYKPPQTISLGYPKTTLVNFKDEKLYFPPPSRWVENEYALYEEPMGGTVVTNERIKNEQTAVCTKDSACQLNGKKFTIKKGQKVTIVDAKPDLKLYKISENGKSGLFVMQDFTILKKQSYTQLLQQESQLSPIHPVQSQNFFKEMPEKDLENRMNKLSQAELAQKSQRILEEDRQVLKKQNMKIIERQKNKLRQLVGN